MQISDLQYLLEKQGPFGDRGRNKDALCPAVSVCDGEINAGPPKTHGSPFCHIFLLMAQSIVGEFGRQPANVPPFPRPQSSFLALRRSVSRRK